MQCQNCGQSNSEQSQFCRFCGTKFLVQQSYVQDNNNYQAPRPYSWQTDEFQTQSEPRKSPPITRGERHRAPQTVGTRNYNAQPLTIPGTQAIDPHYRCPKCMSQYLPRQEKRISTAGWITFSVLLVFFFPLFWIGLLIKEDVHVCPSCNSKVN